MSIDLIQRRLNSYHLTSKESELNAVKEIMQEIALCALSRTDFFKTGAFMGGTCLRILHGLPRFSEDLDFSLLAPDANFRWSPLLEQLALEFSTYGLSLETKERSEVSEAVKRAFLKENSFGKILQLSYERNSADSQKILIKLEVDTNPPAFAKTESLLVRFPFPFSVRTHDLPSLCSGKCLALLCREYDKGRDWFDFLWYVSQGVKPNFEMLRAGLVQHGPWKGMEIVAGADFLLQTLHQKVDSVDWDAASSEVRPFLTLVSSGDVKNWNREYFHSSVDLFLKD
jgi:predicted nucleotidyltransferase component of viral defense system